jgi:peptidoglycan/LPS O-acetylase OafA/YrhL
MRLDRSLALHDDKGTMVSGERALEQPRAAPVEGPRAGRISELVWLDALKGVAMLWIVLNHVVEQLFGGEYVGNPQVGWPALGARVAQFATPVGPGPWLALATAVRDVGWLGDQGVTLFLIASGFGLAYGLQRRGVDRVAPLAFFRARAARIYPLWLGVHAVLLVLLVATWSKVGLGFALSAAGIRFLPQTMYAFVPAWWYVGLLLQLYAITPWLWSALRRFGPGRVLAGACALGFAARAAGLFAFHGYLEEWSRGAIFLTRLPEFAFGAAAALWYARDPERAGALLRRPLVIAAGAASFALGFACAFTLPGMTVAPFLMGSGAFIVLAAALRRERGRGTAGVLAWTGRNSYALYLVHQPFVTALVPAAASATAIAVSARIVAALGLALAAARALEAAVDAFGRWLRGLVARGPLVALVRLALALVAAYALLVIADKAAARFAPLEVNGWGERPSLEPDATTGWKLIPSKTTRLRWTSYDYVVHSNALGYPGPDVAAPKPPGTLRVLVTGDAFTSGEGVGTDAAWPHVLQDVLAQREKRRVQVLNFGITGYGPDQEARVVAAYAPRFHPDVVVFENFVNAFEKLDSSDDEIRTSIGFGNPPGDGLGATLRLYHLRLFAIEDVARPLEERITGKPSPEDVGFADGSAFERADPAVPAEIASYRKALRSARDAARAAHATFLLVMIPSHSQVCSAADFPRGAFLKLQGDPAYDADRPQREASAAARALGVPFLDLRGALGAGACPYQRRNMHFLESGDVITARAVAAAIAPR